MYRAKKVCYRLSRLFYYTLLALGLSLALLLPVKQVVRARENAAALSFPHVHHLWGNNDSQLSATLSTWKEVDLVYERLFPYDRARQPHPPAGCVVLTAMSDHIDKQGTGIKMPPAVLMLRCQERIDLLRPARWVSNRLHQQNRQGYLWLSIPEMGIMDVQVQLVAVRSSSFNPALLDVKSTASRPVIGLFIRHTTNVRQYTFKDTMTGKLDRVKATPNHPFYAVNRHRYIPVSHLSTHDRMVNVLGHPVTLVCPPGKSSHCGHPYHPGQVITVYNLEVYGQHRYFVGEPGILVHNGYNDKYPCTYEGCGKSFSLPRVLRIHMRTHTGEKPFQCDQCLKKFSDPSGYRQHLKTHEESPFRCPICKRKSRDDETFQRHSHTRIQKSHALAIERAKERARERVRARSRLPLKFPRKHILYSYRDVSPGEITEFFDWDKPPTNL